MAFSGRRSLASGLSRHLTGRLHPSLTHLVPSHHDRREDPSCSSSTPPPPTQQPSLFPAVDLRRRASRSQNLTLPLPFGAHFAAHRNFSSEPEVDAAASVLPDPAAGQMDVLSDAASSFPPAFPAPFPGEVAAAAADSFLPVAAVQHLIDAVHSVTGLNWWASIALAMVLVRTATIPFLVHHRKEQMYHAVRTAIILANKSKMDPESRQELKNKLAELVKKHGVSRWTPYKLVFVQLPILLSFTYAIRNMIEKVPSLEGGGAYWFTDLTTPDELCILPVLTGMSFAMMQLNMKPQRKIKYWHMLPALLVVPLSASFCKAHFCYFLPWQLFGLAYQYGVRIPAVQYYLDILPVADVLGFKQQSVGDKSTDAEKKRRT